MPLDKQDIKQISDELGETVKKMQEKNDKRIEAGDKERAKLAGEVHGLVNTVKELQKNKSDLEEKLKSLAKISSRPGRTGEKSADDIAHEEGFRNFILKGEDSGLRELQQKALSTSVDSDGGYAVPEYVDTEITRLLKQSNPMRSLARVIPVTSEGYKKLVSTGGAASGWVGETDARPETGTPTLEPIQPVFGEMYANPATTQKGLDDMFMDPSVWLAEEVQTEFAEQENKAFTVGAGANQPPGFLRAATSLDVDGVRAFGTVQHVVSGDSGVIAPDDIKRFPYKLRAGYRASSVWQMNGLTLEEIMVLKDNEGRYLWRAGLDEGAGLLLVGRPVQENEDMPGIAAGVNAVALGDWHRAYTILDVQGVRTLRDPFTHKPYVHFYTTKRVGGMRSNSEALKFLRIAA